MATSSKNYDHTSYGSLTWNAKVSCEFETKTNCEYDWYKSDGLVPAKSTIIQNLFVQTTFGLTKTKT